MCIPADQGSWSPHPFLVCIRVSLSTTQGAVFAPRLRQSLDCRTLPLPWLPPQQKELLGPPGSPGSSGLSADGPDGPGNAEMPCPPQCFFLDGQSGRFYRYIAWARAYTTDSSRQRQESSCDSVLGPRLPVSCDETMVVVADLAM